MDSPEAIRMLRMVTLGFYDHSRIGLWFFQSLGLEWDEMADWAQNLRDEIFPQTCTWSVSLWEERYGILPDESLSLALRRQRIMAKAQYRAPINPETIRLVVSLLTGVEDVTVRDFTEPYGFEVYVKSQEEVSNLVEVWGRIYEMKPSHLRFRLFYQQETEVTHNLHGGLHYGIYRETDMTEGMLEITEEDYLNWKKEEMALLE